MSRFDEFWKAYPNKQGKAAAKKKWDLKKLDDLADSIIGHVETRAKRDKKWRDGFIPMPTTFLNQERWNDEYQTVEAPKDKDKPREIPPVLQAWLDSLDDDWYWALKMLDWAHQPKEGPIFERIEQLRKTPRGRIEAARIKFGLASRPKGEGAVSTGASREAEIPFRNPVQAVGLPGTAGVVEQRESGVRADSHQEAGAT